LRIRIFESRRQVEIMGNLQKSVRLEMDQPKSVKRRIVEMLQRLPDDIDFDRAIEGVHVLRDVEIALEQVRQGDVFDDDEVMSELLSD
jgi:hypothetical protein